MKALIDGDILRYEVGFGSETGWQYDGGPPQFSYVEDLLLSRIEQIVYEAGADEYELFLTNGKSFRHDIATTKPYKGHRIPNKPYHFDNLTEYMKGVLNATVVEGIEGDDGMAIESVANSRQCIICSRDKDLKQVPGWYYSWELGSQPSYGPSQIDCQGSLALNEKKYLTGTGFLWFCAQLLMGDRVDNIPGLKGWGPIRAYEALKDKDAEEAMFEVRDLYDNDEYLLEQGQLLWIVRRFNEDGTPELWTIGQTK